MYGFGETITIVSLTYMVVVDGYSIAVPYCPASQDTTENLHADFLNRNRTLDGLHLDGEGYILLRRMVSHQASTHFYLFKRCDIMKKNIDDVLRDHITIYDELINDKEKYIEQVDYLAFYCDQKARELCNPFDEYIYGDRDNTNWIHTKYENVYAMIDEKQRIFLTYSEGGNAPITILRRAKYKERRRIDIYGKALKLYYSGKITWLEDYVKKYQGETQRVDLCRDMKNKPNEYICDLGYNKNGEKTGKKVIVETNNEWTYRTYGAKDSRLFVRIYDKTLDLKQDKFIHAYLYPDWYKKECRRLEAKLTLEYARADTPYNRLKMIKRDKNIERKENKERLMYKTILLYTIGIAEMNVPNIEECIYVLNQARIRINNKINLLNNKLPKGKDLN